MRLLEKAAAESLALSDELCAENASLKGRLVQRRHDLKVSTKAAKRELKSLKVTCANNMAQSSSMRATCRQALHHLDDS